MATWFTADLHFGHANIIGYCQRPFTDVDAMNRALVDNWNEVVAESDTVWIVGDFALGKPTETLPFATELHGHKILLAGNHDRCWGGHGPRAERWIERYLEAGFAEVVQDTATINVAGRSVLVSHFPYRGDSHGLDRFVEHRPDDQGTWLLHGHVHDRWAQQGRMINVGVDVTGFRPISESSIAALIDGGPSDRSQHPDQAQR